MRALSSFLRWCSGKESTYQCRRHKRLEFDPWVRKIPWKRKRQPTPIFSPGKSHGQKSLAGYRPWGHRVRHDWVTAHTRKHWGEADSSVRQPVRSGVWTLKDPRVAVWANFVSGSSTSPPSILGTIVIRKSFESLPRDQLWEYVSNFAYWCALKHVGCVWEREV